jgi:hypothetical protein
MRSLAGRIAFIGGIFFTAAIPSIAQLPLRGSLGAQSVTVTGVTGSGKVILFGVTREPLNTTPATPATVVRAVTLEDDDGDGAVTLELPIPLPPIGMWAAVQLETGARAVFVLRGFAAREVTLASTVLQRDSGGELRKLQWPFAEIDLLIVRPGEGAWHTHIAKTSTMDENRHNAGLPIRIDVASLTAIGNSPAGPGSLQPGDVVVVFDRREMQYGSMQVSQ